ncbi:MAG: SIMPL domain-containing protein [Glaciecola sp.]
MTISLRHLALFLCVWCFSNIVQAQTQLSPSPQRTISVQGSGTILIVPNQLEFSVAVEQRGTDTKILQQQVQKKVSDIVYLLQQNGINDRNIQSMEMSLQPHYEYDNGKRTHTDFIFVRTIYVKHNDFTVYSTLMQALIKAGATSISPALLTHSNPKQQYLDALKLAVEDAKKRAITMLEPLQAKLGDVLSVNEQSRQQPVAYRAKSMAMLESSSIDLPGEKGIEARVGVTFLVR